MAPLGFLVAAGAAAEREVFNGIRPEHIHIATAGIGGKTLLVEATGSEVFTRLDCSGEVLSCLFRQRGLTLQLGQAISVRIDPADVHLFDAQTGSRL